MRFPKERATGIGNDIVMLGSGGVFVVRIVGIPVPGKNGVHVIFLPFSVVGE